MGMRSAAELGDPSLPFQTAADPRSFRQPNTQPVGTLTGAPPRTQLFQLRVTPVVNSAGVLQVPTRIVPATRENRFITLVAPLTGFLIYVKSEAAFNLLSDLSLPPGLPYEISLPGNQELFAVTDAPIFLSLRVQVTAAISSDTERRL